MSGALRREGVRRIFFRGLSPPSAALWPGSFLRKASSSAAPSTCFRGEASWGAVPSTSLGREASWPTRGDAPILGPRLGTGDLRRYTTGCGGSGRNADDSPEAGRWGNIGWSSKSGPGGGVGGAFLVTGALGQIGAELVPYLRSRFGEESVIASDIRAPPHGPLQSGPFEHLDVRDPESLAHIIHEHKVGCILHLASLLSASGERNPQLALDVNVKSIHNVLEAGRQFKVRVFAPSTIAVFGPSAPKDLTPDVCAMDPTTIYGITKVHLELLGRYYRHTYNVDFRSLRYPGIISSSSPPGGGTTDYAVDMFRFALSSGRFNCYLATAQLLTAPPDHLTQCVYNVTAMSFSPEDLAEAISEHIPSFHVDYRPDFRQNIASTWPRSVDDERARRDWNWCPTFNLKDMTSHMLNELAPSFSHEHALMEASVC